MGVMGHAGGPIPFDRVVFEMAARGEAGCSLVSDPKLHDSVLAIMIEIHGRKDGTSTTWMRLALGNLFA